MTTTKEEIGQIRKRMEKAVDDLARHGLLDGLVDAIAKRHQDPYSIAEKVVDHRFAFRENDAGPVACGGHIQL